jgi:hypothetical protein
MRLETVSVSLRIAFDLDGLLADMDSARKREEDRLFGEAGSTSPTLGRAEQSREPRSLTDDQRRQLWQALGAIDDFWETLDEIEPGAVAAIAARARARRWEIIFLTSRPETAGSTPQLQTQRWLQRHGFDLPSVFVVSRSRGRIAEALGLDVVVDDLPENCRDVVSDSNATAILVWRRPLDTFPDGVRQIGCTVVASVEESLSILAGMERDARKPTLLERLKQAFGPANAR